MKELPLGISAFEIIKQRNCLYVDKTEHIHRLVSSGTVYFLSRPRRFGKSLLVSTLKCLFQGRKELFEGLWIASHGAWEWQPHPIVLLDFNEIPHNSPEQLARGLATRLRQIAAEHDISLQPNDLEWEFNQLILALFQKTQQPVVVLIDEYDKPLIDHLGRGEQGMTIAKANRDILKTFFGVLKGATVSTALRFVLLTGVSRFSRVSIFSELNNLYDLSMSAPYADMLGYTQAELERDFQPHLEQLAQTLGWPMAQLMAKLEQQYNGYRFSERNIKVYNPFSILNALVDLAIKNYWFVSGTPTFLVNLLREKQFHVADIEQIEVTPSVFTTFDLDNLKSEALLFQTGYVTIKDVQEELYILGYPNQEVKVSFSESLLQSFFNGVDNGLSSHVWRLLKYLRGEEFERFIASVQTIFATIPYDIQTKRDEAYYHTLFYLMIAASGGEARSSVLTNRGRIDLVILFKDKVYILEFKCNQSAAIALQQIKDKGYAEAYRGGERKIILMGLNFSTEERNLVEWAVE